jgi:hypothetical protein
MHLLRQIIYLTVISSFAYASATERQVFNVRPNVPGSAEITLVNIHEYEKNYCNNAWFFNCQGTSQMRFPVFLRWWLI